MWRVTSYCATGTHDYANFDSNIASVVYAFTACDANSNYISHPYTHFAIDRNRASDPHFRA